MSEEKKGTHDDWYEDGYMDGYNDAFREHDKRKAELKSLVKQLEQSLDAEIGKVDLLEKEQEKYQELLYCVEQKVPDETRHETAKRYITEREKWNNPACGQAI